MNLLALIGVEREALDCRSSGDRRERVDAYFVAYRIEGGEWCCRFEVPRGAKFVPRMYASSEEANQNKGYTL